MRIDVDASNNRTLGRSLRNTKPVSKCLIVSATEDKRYPAANPHRRDSSRERSLPCEHIILRAGNVPRIEECECCWRGQIRTRRAQRTRALGRAWSSVVCSHTRIARVSNHNEGSSTMTLRRLGIPRLNRLMPPLRLGLRSIISASPLPRHGCDPTVPA
jgi:hypothetical protein